MNNKIAAAVMALLMSAGLAATARAAGDTMLDSAQTLVNGKPYVAKTNLANGDKLTFNGPGFVKINGVTFDFTGTATAVYENGVLQFSSAGSASDSITVTDASGNKKAYAGASASGLMVEVSAPDKYAASAATAKEQKEALAGRSLGDINPFTAFLAIYNQFNGVGSISPAQGVTLQVSPSAP